MPSRPTRSVVVGAAIGMVLGIFAGGVTSTLLGQPFSGVKGIRVFPLGMVFPGLVVFAPLAAGIGAVVGAVVRAFRK